MLQRRSPRRNSRVETSCDCVVGENFDENYVVNSRNTLEFSKVIDIIWPIFKVLIPSMDDLQDSLLGVKCRDFERTLNCSSKRLPVEVLRSCCGDYYDVSEQPPQDYYFKTLYKCCEALGGHGYAPPKETGWENSSYQAYVMGIAVFAILICLFVSGARSVRRRRMLLRAQQRQQGTDRGGLSANRAPELNTQISLGPPTYGELEASGLTKDYKTGAFDPPPYPGITSNQGEYIQCVVSPMDGGENAVTGEYTEEKAIENEPSPIHEDLPIEDTPPPASR